MSIDVRSSEADYDFIREYVAAGATPEARKLLREQCAHTYGLTIGQVRAITAWTTIRLKKSLKQTESSAVNHQVEAPPSEQQILDEPAVSEEGDNVDTAFNASADEDLPALLIGGEHVDYDNAIKQRWRETWKEFLDKHTDPAKRASMLVLCLPGKKCLEIPLYLELGFKPENIVGVEGGDEDAWKEFEANAKKYGISTVRGDLLMDFWQYTNQRFDVLSYDFLGPSCNHYVKTVAASLVKEDAVVMLNFMKKRESKSAQFKMQGWAPVSTDEFETALANAEGTKVERAMQIGKMFREKVMNAEKGEVEIAPLEHLRQNSIINLYGQMLGINRPENSLFYEQIQYLLSEEHAITTQEGFEAVAIAVYNAMEKQKGGAAVAITYANGLRGLVSAAWQRIPLATDIAQVQYKSMASGKACPFHTVMMKCNTPLQEYYGMRHTLEFMLNAVRHYVDHPEDRNALTAVIRDKSGFIIPDGTEPRRNQQVYIRDGQGNSITSVQMGTLTRDTEAYLALAAKDLKPAIISGSYIPEVQVLD